MLFIRLYHRTIGWFIIICVVSNVWSKEGIISGLRTSHCDLYSKQFNRASMINLTGGVQFNKHFKTKYNKLNIWGNRKQQINIFQNVSIPSISSLSGWILFQPNLSNHANKTIHDKPTSKWHWRQREKKKNDWIERRWMMMI